MSPNYIILGVPVYVIQSPEGMELDGYNTNMELINSLTKDKTCPISVLYA